MHMCNLLTAVKSQSQWIKLSEGWMLVIDEITLVRNILELTTTGMLAEYNDCVSYKSRFSLNWKLRIAGLGFQPQNHALVQSQARG